MLEKIGVIALFASLFLNKNVKKLIGFKPVAFTSCQTQIKLVACLNAFGRA